MSEPGPDAIVEALLFCSGRSLSCSELATQSSMDEEQIAQCLDNLRGQYKRRRGNALQIVEVGGRWSMEDALWKMQRGRCPEDTSVEDAQRLVGYRHTLPFFALPGPARGSTTSQSASVSYTDAKHGPVLQTQSPPTYRKNART